MITDKQIEQMIERLERAKRKRRIKKFNKRVVQKKLNKNAIEKEPVFQIDYPNWFTPFKVRFHRYLTSDLKKGHTAIDYSFEEFRNKLTNAKCFYCGIQDNLGLDRIDNSKGHTKENTLVACYRCNMTRGNWFSVYEMKQIGSLIKTFS